eukprot:14601053-Alexandrium_andersonii.AAC.1
MIAVGGHTPALVVSAYGWATDQEGSRFAKTDELAAAIVQELRAWPELPIVIGGDLNASTSQLPSLAGLL